GVGWVGRGPLAPLAGRVAPRVGADDGGADAVAVDAPRRHRHAAWEAGEGEEAGDHRAALAVEDLDVRARAGRAGAGDDVGGAVAVDVADGHTHLARVVAVRGEDELLRAP